MPTKRSGLLLVGLQSQQRLESKSVFSKLRESVNPEEIMPIGIAITAIQTCRHRSNNLSSCRFWGYISIANRRYGNH